MLAAADSITTIYQMRLQLYPVHAVAICLPTKLTGFGAFVASNLTHKVSPWCGFFVFFPLKLCWWWSDLLSGRCDAPSKPVFSKTSRIEHDSDWKQQTSGSTHVFFGWGHEDLSAAASFLLYRKSTHVFEDELWWFEVSGLKGSGWSMTVIFPSQKPSLPFCYKLL